MTEEIMRTIANHDWPEWATHVVVASYDPATEQLKTLCNSGKTFSVRLVDGTVILSPNVYSLATKVILIPVDLDGESPDSEGDYRLELVGDYPQYVQSSDVVPIIRGKAPVEGVPVDVLTSVLLGLRKDDENITEAELLKVYQFAKDFERFFKKPEDVK